MPTCQPLPAPAMCVADAPAPARTAAAPAPLGLLPTPTPQEVAGFTALYERKYAVRLESDQAQRLLAGLMRFLYLTRTAPPDAAAAPEMEKSAA